MWLGIAFARIDNIAGHVPSDDVERNPATHLFIINPLSGAHIGSLFSTHPPVCGSNRTALSQIAIPFDHVDPEATARPIRWDIRLIERFMLVFGPISSLFDFVTFYAIVALFGAGEALFHTGWFIESLATQVLVIFATRTRRQLFRSRPDRLLSGLATTIVLLGTMLPVTPLAPWLGFAPPPRGFFAFLAGAVIAYLTLVELVKVAFYKHPVRAGGRRRTRITENI